MYISLHADIYVYYHVTKYITEVTTFCVIHQGGSFGTRMSIAELMGRKFFLNIQRIK